jgi:signal transduction protein with GAF and PtsI domain
LETGQPVLCEDAENDARVERSVARALHLRSALAVPIHAQGSVLGVVEVFSCRPSAFNAAHVSELQRIAGILSPILARGPTPDENRLQVRRWSPPKWGGGVVCRKSAHRPTADRPVPGGAAGRFPSDDYAG